MNDSYTIKQINNVIALILVGNLFVDDDSLLPLLTLPQLEKFKCKRVDGFPDIELPELKHLIELDLGLIENEPYLTGLFEAIKKMPRLEKLVIDFRLPWETEDETGNAVLLELVCGVAKVITSFGKDVVVGDDSSTAHTKKLLITKLSNYKEAKKIHERGEILELTLNYEHEKPLFDGVAAFVRNKLYLYNTVIFENKNQEAI